MGKAKIAALVGAALASGSAAAAPSFDEWSVTDGLIDPCSDVTNATSCEVLVSDNGFVQAQVYTDDGVYIKSIVTDLDATGSAGDDSLLFYDENYIKILNQPQVSTVAAVAGDPGFMGKQKVQDPTQVFNSFSLDTVIATGWGIAEIHPDSGDDIDTYISLDQKIATTSATGSGDIFDSEFFFESETRQVEDADGNIVTEIAGYRLDINQFVSLGVIDDPTTVDDSQTFIFMDRQGTMLTSAGVWGSSTDDLGNIDLAFDNENFVDSGSFFPDHIEWVEGGQISAFWIDQSVSTSGFGEGTSDFYHLQVDNTGPADFEYAYSQGGAGFGNPDPSTMEAVADWVTDAELTEFPIIPDAVLEYYPLP